MTRIPPIPTTRIGDLFARQRLTAQTQADQIDVFRLQNQISTGQRLFLPSDDAPSALRAMNLQRLLERKEQIYTNLDGSNSFLAGADISLSSVSNLLTDLRGAVVGVVGTPPSDQEREAVIAQIDHTLEQLINAGNATFRDRYLFSGSQSLSQPYADRDGFVEYSGNEINLRSYVDIGLLFDTNLPGTQVLGGISAQVTGSVDLNAHLTPQTLLRDINGGQGVRPGGSIAFDVVSGGTSESVIVDLSNATTVDDVARLIEDQAPALGQISVDINGTGLTISSAVGGNIFINEVAGGTTASELGIYTGNDTPTSLVQGTDLNPAVVRTTPLSNLLGTKSVGRLQLGGANNDLLITAGENGDFDNVDVVIVDTATAGLESVSYDGLSKTLTVNIESGVSTAAQIAAAIDAEGTFSAEIDNRDALSLILAGTGIVSSQTITAATSGGSGAPLDTGSGLIVTNGGDPVTIELGDAQTVEDLLNLLNAADAGLLAEINADGTGINIRSRRSGADLTIGENGGTTASQLGVRTYTESTRLADLNRGIGVLTEPGDDITIAATDGTTFSVDLTGAANVGDVLDLINTHPTNTGQVTARLAVTGNGIELVDNASGASAFVLSASGASQAAELLGFLPDDADSVTATGSTIQSEDRHTLEVDSVFNTLLRLRTALQDNNADAVGRELERLDDDLFRVNFSRSELGSRQQSLDALRIRLEDEEVQLRAALSDEIDVDLVEAISNMSLRQLSLEASLRTTASILQLSVLNFL